MAKLSVEKKSSEILEFFDVGLWQKSKMAAKMLLFFRFWYNNRINISSNMSFYRFLKLLIQNLTLI